MISLPALNSFFAVTQHSSGDCSIKLFQLAPSSPDRVSQLSFLLAMQFMHKLCEGAPLVFNRWFERLETCSGPARLAQAGSTCVSLVVLVPTHGHIRPHDHKGLFHCFDQPFADRNLSSGRPLSGRS